MLEDHRIYFGGVTGILDVGSGSGSEFEEDIGTLMRVYWGCWIWGAGC